MSSGSEAKKTTATTQAALTMEDDLKSMGLSWTWLKSHARRVRRTLVRRIKREVRERFDRRHIWEYVEDQNDRQPRCLEM